MFPKRQGPTTSYRVELPSFEGPLDLLLSLVDQAKLDITEVSLAAVAGQYQSYIEALTALDVEVESSYLVVFAQLLEIKSKLLLPEPPPDPEEVSSSEESGESTGLVARLKEYQLMKQIADWMGEREGKSLARYPHPCGKSEPDHPALDMSLSSVHAAALRLLKPSKPFKPAPTFKKIEISVPERVAQVWAWLAGKRKALFGQLLGKAPSKGLIVVTFLAVLELARRGRVRLHQEHYRADLEIENEEV